MPCRLQRLHLLVEPIRVVRRSHPDEHTIVPVYLRAAERLAVDRNQSLAVLPRALRDKLLRPRSEARQTSGQERYLVAPIPCQLRERRAETHAGLRIELPGTFQQQPDVDADDSRWH